MDDKTKHNLAGTGVTLVSGILLFLITKNPGLSISIGFTLGLLAGLGKEYYDLKASESLFRPVLHRKVEYAPPFDHHQSQH